MAAQVVKALPEGDDWIYELQFDGYRALIIKDEQRVELRSRKNKDLTGMYRDLKIDELLKATRGARSMINLDRLSDQQLMRLEAEFKRICSSNVESAAVPEVANC